MSKADYVIELDSIGAIRSAKILIPKDGGVVVLTGRNGSGKSTALEAIQSRDDGQRKAARHGHVEERDRQRPRRHDDRRSIGASTRELRLRLWKVELSIADLVDPGFVDPERADAKRIKALVGLSKADINAGDLHGFPANLTKDLSLDDPVSAMSELRKRLNIGASEYEAIGEG